MESKINDENNKLSVYVAKDSIEDFMREILFNMLVKSKKYLVAFIGYTIYSIPQR